MTELNNVDAGEERRNTIWSLHVRGVGVTIFITLGILFGVGLYVLNSPPISWKESVTVRIERGTSAGAIGDQLYAQQLIRSSRAFRWFAKLSGTSSSLKSGTFVLEPSSTQQLLWRLSQGAGEARVTIPEGTRAKEIANLFSKEGIMIFERDLTPFEGYLFPDTYQVAKDATAEDVVRILQNQFKEEWVNIAPFVGARTQKDIVIMASILEKESAGDGDRAIISGILWKRLAKGMRLQVDATLAYERGETSATLSQADLQKDSPYNTYTRSGLPPTPIGNPGLKALLAAAKPEASPYLYYLHDTKGNTYYARTLEEHVANKRKYLK